MKPVNFFSITLLGIFITTSCTKKQELDITMNVVEDGDLKVVLIDDSNVGLANVAVSLESGYASPIAEGVSDENGLVLFNDILSGTYLINAKNVAVNSKAYNVSQIAQVIAGTTKSYTVNPADFSGTVVITVVDFFDRIPVEDVTIGVFRTEDYKYNMLFADVLDILVDSGQTDSNGKITFERLPLTTYGALVYSDELTTEIDQYSFDLRKKGDEELITLEY